jgi:membrane fusion protein (multidrug efflux system)
MPAITRQKLMPAIAAGVVIVALLIGGGVWWSNKQKYETTDNAFVAADTVQVSPQVAGYIAEVLVGDNESVQAGQVLARIDPAPFQARLDQALANAQALEAAVAGVDDKAKLEEAMIAQKAAGVTSAEAAAAMAKADETRYGALAGQGWVSPQKIQTQRAMSQQAAAAVGQANATLEAERRTAQALGSARAQSLAQAAGARAAVEQAKLDLEHTVIRAPVSGVVGARGIRTGQLVQPGSPVLAVVPLGQTYVVANFKETQLARLRIGQPVEIHADAFGKIAIKGHLDSFSPAAGQTFALIPVENAVGNFTKIAQRVPVRIVVDRDRSGPASAGLRPGLSVEIKVDVTSNTGPSFAESGQLGPRLARRDPVN